MTEQPHRVQLRRAKGWRMPPNTVSVARPSGWGNPYIIGGEMTREMAVAAYREYLLTNSVTVETIRDELRGKNLACFCPLNQPCHADVLLELANASPTQPGDREVERHG